MVHIQPVNHSVNLRIYNQMLVLPVPMKIPIADLERLIGFSNEFHITAGLIHRAGR